MLVRLAAELDRLDADEQLDTAVRARTVARVCAVALAAYRKVDADDPGEQLDEGGRLDFAALSDRELRTLQRLAGKIRRVSSPPTGASA